MDAPSEAVPDGEPTTRAEQKLLASAREHLGGEQVLSVVRGQTLVSPIILPLVGSLLFVFGVRPRTVIVTEKSVLTVQESIWAQSKVVRVVSRYDRGAARLHLTRLGLRIGEDRRIFAMLGSLAAMKHAAMLESSAGV